MISRLHGAGKVPGSVRFELAAGLTGVAASSLLLGLATGRWSALPTALTVYALIALTVVLFWPQHRRRFGAANRITLLRGGLIALLAGQIAHQPLPVQAGWLLTALALAVLLLDGVDGWVARRLGCCSRFGKRFDMELDALLILVLCVASLALGKVGSWVLAIGLMRYAFVGAGWFLPWLRAELPDSLRRKSICVIQVIILLLVPLPFVNAFQATGLVGLALVLLGLSFAVDIRWLSSRRSSKTPFRPASHTSGESCHVHARTLAPSLPAVVSSLSATSCQCRADCLSAAHDVSGAGGKAHLRDRSGAFFDRLFGRSRRLCGRDRSVSGG